MKAIAQFSFLLAFIFLFQNIALADNASAIIQGTSPESNISGVLHLEEKKEGLRIHGEIKNVSPGDHGFHIHEKGSCEDKGNGAGGHFNPHGASHGLLSKDGINGAHAGDFGNVTAKANGLVKIDMTFPELNLKSEDLMSIAGKSFILHEKPDDFGQPTGNAGGRIACGVISTVQNNGKWYRFKNYLSRMFS